VDRFLVPAIKYISSHRQLRSLAHKVIERENLDAIVLVGTDLAFVFNEENTDFPHLDGARVHIKAIMDALLKLSRRMLKR
jgi:aspartate/glutamate racemase